MHVATMATRSGNITAAQQEPQLVAAHRALYAGMLSRDTHALGALLADEYTLTHMTGYVQPKEEWLRQIESGQMRYHSAKEHSISASPAGPTRPWLSAKTSWAPPFGEAGARGDCSWSRPWKTGGERGRR